IFVQIDTVGIRVPEFAGDRVDSDPAQSGAVVGLQQSPVIAADVDNKSTGIEPAASLHPRCQLAQMGPHRGVGSGLVSVSVGEQFVLIDGVPQLAQPTIATMHERERRFQRVGLALPWETAGEGLLSKIHDFGKLSTAADTTRDNFLIPASREDQIPRGGILSFAQHARLHASAREAYEATRTSTDPLTGRGPSNECRCQNGPV